MTACDRWLTTEPEYDEPELTGLADEAQQLVDRLYDAMHDMAADYAAEGCFPPNVMRYHARLSRIAARADRRVQRRIMAQVASADSAPTCPFCDATHAPGKCPVASGGGPWEELRNARARVERMQAEIDRLFAEQVELSTRLAEYRSVNALATATLEKYVAKYGPLS